MIFRGIFYDYTQAGWQSFLVDEQTQDRNIDLSSRNDSIKTAGMIILVVHGTVPQASLGPSQWNMQVENLKIAHLVTANKALPKIKNLSIYPHWKRASAV